MTFPTEDVPFLSSHNPNNSLKQMPQYTLLLLQCQYDGHTIVSVGKAKKGKVVPVLN
jgi:hypothetical protein